GDEVLRLPARSEVALVTVDPVADQLHPTITALRLAGHRGGEVLRLELIRVADEVAAGAGEVPPAADEARQVVLLLQRRVVDDRAGIADEEHAGVPVHDRLLTSFGKGGAPSPVSDPEVAVQVGEAGDDESVDLQHLS